MASINISNLHAVGSELFMDSESFMNDLADQELSVINGGTSPLAVPVVIWGVEITAGWVASAMVSGAAVGAYSALKK